MEQTELQNDLLILHANHVMEQTILESDAMAVMEQIQMAESRHMQMGALCSYLLQYPDMTIRDFFAMAAAELEEQEEELGYYE